MLARARVHRETLLACAFALAALCGYAAAAIFRFDRYGANAYDLGIYDQSVWLLAHFHPLAENTVQRLPTPFVELPLFFVTAPLYWLWDDARMLLIAQAALLATASIPLFLWARLRLGTVEAFLFQLAFLVYFGILSGDVFDVHPAAVACLLTSVGLYALLERRTPLLLAALALLLVTKENYSFLVVAFGVYILLVERRRRFGASVVAVALAWFAFVFKVYLPAIAGGAKYANWFYPALGSGPGEAAWHVVRHPVDTVRVFFTPHAKLRGLFNLFAPWLFLPLASPILIIGVPTLAERFFSDKPAYWQQGFHYTLPLAPVLAFAAVDTVARVPLGNRGRLGVGALVLLAGLYFSFVRLKPLDELRRYTPAAHAAEIDRCLSTIPPKASVVATSALVPHLSHRRRIWVFDERPDPKAQVIAIDTVTWIFPRTVSNLGAVVRRALRDGYGVTCATSATIVLRQGAPAKRMPPELRRTFASAS